MSTQQPPDARTDRRRRLGRYALALAVVLGAGFAVWRVLGHLPYRIDVDVYRMGGRAWLDSRPLYADGTLFATRGGLDLPFTYPPLAAVVFSPLAVLPLGAAEVAITVITFLLLGVTVWIVLTALRVGADGGGRAWIAAGVVAAGTLWLEPIQANFSFGQVNAVLMTLVVADCVPRRTRWPRGVLLGIAIALKLTPAVFLLYFLMRRDIRAAVTAAGGFAAATALGFALAWRDSVQYWTATVADTGRIGTATWNTNQNASGALARLGLGETAHFAVWTLASVATLGLTVWAVRRVLAGPDADEAGTLALICVALFGLVVSPVSWSHHWVWALPTLVVLVVAGYRRRSAALSALAVAGAALMTWSPIVLLPEHHEAHAAWWRQLLGMSYVWWALAVITAAGVTAAGRFTPRRSPGSAPAVDLVHPAH